MLNLFISLQNRLADLRNEEGQTMAEYGVVLAVITVFIIGALVLLAGGIEDALNSVTAVL
jgi:Flp pilus assembly pilin Flp